MITQVFGRGPKSSEVYTALREATLFMIVDALDEGRVKVTETAFEDFLRDLGQLASEGSSVKAVLFGRTQVAETAWLLLDDQGVRTAFYTIDPFDEEQAVQVHRAADPAPRPACSDLDGPESKTFRRGS